MNLKLFFHLTAPQFINDGPHKNKITLVAEFNMEHRTVTSKKGLVLPMEIIQPVLKPIAMLNDVQAAWVFRMFWQQTTADDWSGDTGSAYFKPKKVAPTVEHVLRIFDGRDYATDSVERMQIIIPQLLEWNFDVFNGIADGWAVNWKNVMP